MSDNYLFLLDLALSRRNQITKVGRALLARGTDDYITSIVTNLPILRREKKQKIYHLFVFGSKAAQERTEKTPSVNFGN